MKKFVLLIALAFLALPLLAQEKESKDTISVNYLAHIDKGDILPFKYLYQRLKIKADDSDTTLAVSVVKDITLEATDVNKDMGYIVFLVTEENFQKTGSEAGSPLSMRATSSLKDISGVEMVVTMGGDILGLVNADSLFMLAQKNLEYVADTMSKHSSLSKEELMEENGFLTDTVRILKQVYKDLSDLFFFCQWDMVPDEVYVVPDSLYSYVDDRNLENKLLFTMDSKFAESVPEYNGLYVLRRARIYENLLFLRWFGVKDPEEDALKLLEKYKDRSMASEELFVLADKAMGIPLLVESNVLVGFYDKVGDDYISQERIVLVLDYDRLMDSQGDDDEEEEEDGEPRYDDYGFIKVK